MTRAKHGKPSNATVAVRDNNLDQALKVLKRKMQQSGAFREMKARRFHVPNGEQRRLDQEAGIKRTFNRKVKELTREEGISKADAVDIIKGRTPSPR